MRLRNFYEVVRDAGVRWWNHAGYRLGAALAFYTLLSLAPLLVVVTTVAGWVFGAKAASGQLVDEIRGLAGDQGAEVIQTTLANAYQQKATGWFATALGLGLLLFGATGVFSELQDALNIIWGAQGRSTTLWTTLRDRFLSFSMVLGVAFLLMVSLVISAVLSALAAYGAGWLPQLAFVVHTLHLLFSLGLLTLLFALIFKFLPDVPIAWSDVWIGSAVTAGLFSIGKLLIGLYLGQSSFASAYGAAGSFAVFFVWVYYSAQILYFGAEFTQSYASHFGSLRDPYGSEARAEAAAHPGCPTATLAPASDGQVASQPAERVTV